jgi:hypothetical protein
MASIDTLTKDLQAQFSRAIDGSGTLIPEELLVGFGTNVAMHVADTLRARTRSRKPNTIYMSEVGTPCYRKLWYSVYHPEYGEKLQDHTQFKFLYGDLIEEIALLLAETAGHKVERRQERKEYESHGWRFTGRLDAVIDGVLVDVKSASPYSFKKFERGLTDENDSFGYRSQLSMYNGWDVPEFERQGFLVIDKQSGHVKFFEYPWESQAFRMGKCIGSVSTRMPPPRSFAAIPEGKSGNMKLCVECSYCQYKQKCWEDANGGAGLKGYAYSTGPVFLTEVKREPAVASLPLAA